MSIPAVPPTGPPSGQPPLDPMTRSRKKARRQGTLVAILVAFLGFMATLSSFILPDVQLPLAGPGTVVLCVILGSILTIFERTRQFAVGFLIASAILLVVTAGACVALIAAVSSSFSLGTA